MLVLILILTSIGIGIGIVKVFCTPAHVLSETERGTWHPP